MVMERGEVWWVALPEPIGSEPGWRRPMVLVQADSFNRSRIQTVVAVAVTTNTNLAGAPGNVRLPRRDTGLAQDSVANVSQILTIDKAALVERAGTLSSPLLRRIEAGLRLVLDL
jgi:mRNA interferase MazF